MDAMPNGQIDVTYRATCYPIGCSSIVQGFHKKINGYLMGVAVENGSLASIWGENDLIDGDQGLSQWKVDPKLIEKAKAARDAAMQCMEACCPRSEDMTADHLKMVMASNKDVLMSIDSNWDLMDALFGMIVGSGSTARFQELMLRCLPSSQNLISPMASAKKMEALGCTKAMAFMGYANQATLRAWMSTIDQIKHHQKAEMSSDGSTHQKLVAARMSLWLTAEKDGQIIRGKAAAKCLTDAMNAKDDENITMADIQDLHTFAWLLESATIEKIEKIKASLIGDRAIVVADLGNQRSSGASRGSRDLALSYF
jgi:hypothetical protein